MTAATQEAIKAHRTNWDLREAGLDSGAASIRLELSNGGIKVLHGQDGSLLAELPEAKAGTWKAIWANLEALGFTRVGG